MAAPSLTEGKTLLTQPFVVRRLEVVVGTDAGNIAHGLGRTPDVVLHQQIGAIDNDAEVSIVSMDATNLNVDAQAAATVYIYCILFDQASGGFSDSAIPLTSP